MYSQPTSLRRLTDLMPDVEITESLRKTAADRSLVHDFWGGVDPTGTKTFRYGITDVGDPEKRNLLRQMVGMGGGFLAGALLLPSLMASVVKGGKGFMATKGFGKRLLGMLTGMGKGFISPYTSVYRGLHAQKALKAIRAGKKPTEAGMKAVQKLLRQHVGGLPGAPALLSKKPVLSTFARMSPELYNAVIQKIRGQVGMALTLMAMGGSVNALSSLLQYRMAQGYGSRVSRRQREKMLRIPEAT